MDRRNTFLEQEMCTEDQVRRTNKKIKEQIDEFTQEGRTEQGAMVLLDSTLRHRDVVKFIRAMLLSSRDETDLFVEIYEILRDPLAFRIDPDDVDVKGIEDLENLINKSRKTLSLLYESGTLERQAQLRKLLTSEGGALRAQAEKGRFFSMLFKEWIAEDGKQQDLSQVIERVKEALIDIDDWQLLYFALQGVLRDKICRPPQKRVNPSTIYPIQADAKNFGVDINIYYEEKNQHLPIYLQATFPDPGQLDREKPWESAGLWNGSMEQEIKKFLEEKGLTSSVDYDEMTPIHFITETVKSTGAMGVRFLQNLELAVDVPEAYRDTFSEVYDAVKGQSKLAAIHVVEREWPEMWEHIREFRGTIGGGSIVTVYEVVTTEGESRVMKVRNPNIKYHLDEMYRFARQVIDHMQKRGDESVVSAGLLLDDIKRWIDIDMDFSQFTQDDAEFRHWVQQAKENGLLDSERYEVYIPESFGPENSYFIQEEYVPSIGLTQWETLEAQGHDMKEIVGLLVRFYVEQIKQGQVHSDVHLGNFGITPDNRLVIYDRNFYLRLTDQEKLLIGAMLGAGVSSEMKKNLFVEYLKQGNNGQALSEEGEKHAFGFIQAVEQREWKQVHKELIAIKKAGIQTPLTFTLLLKNLHVLQKMAVRAGVDIESML